jgi:hypothetical protein
MPFRTGERYLIVALLLPAESEEFKTISSLPGCQTVSDFPHPGDDLRLAQIRKEIDRISANHSPSVPKFSSSIDYIVIIPDFPKSPTDLEFSLDAVFSFGKTAPTWISHLPFWTLFGALNSTSEFSNQIDLVCQILSSFPQTPVISHIPALPPSRDTTDTTALNEYLADPLNEVVNALFYQLRQSNWKCSPMISKQVDPLDSIFEGFSEFIDRRVVSASLSPIPRPFFTRYSFYGALKYLYPLLSWQITPQNAGCTRFSSQFFGNLEHFFAYAGTRLSILSDRLSQDDFDIPDGYFDARHWTLSWGIPSLPDALFENSVVETLFEEKIGVMWLLVIPRVLSSHGAAVARTAFPASFGNIREYFESLNAVRGPAATRIQDVGKMRLFEADRTAENRDPLKRLQQSDHFFDLPKSTTESPHLCAPYVLPNGVAVTFSRHVPDSFSYSIVVPDRFQIQSTSDSILFQPADSLRVLIQWPSSITIIFNDQILTFDCTTLALRPDKGTPHIISLDGTVFFDRGHTKVFVRPDGCIWEKSGGVWTCTNPDGEVSVNRKRKRRQSFAVDNEHGLRMVRHDSIGYTISSASTRTITYLPDCSVEQSPTGLSFDIPDFPVVLIKHSEIEFEIDKFVFHLQKTGGGSISTDNFTASFNSELFEAESGTCRLSCSPRHCEVSVSGSKLSGGADGHERYEIPKSLSNAHIFKTTPPCFFCVRSDLSVTEFLRPDSPVFQQGSQHKRSIQSPFGGFARILSVVPEDPELPPSGFVEHVPMDRGAVARLVEKFEAALGDAEKNAESVEDAEAARAGYLGDLGEFERAVAASLEEPDAPAMDLDAGQFMPEAVALFQARETPAPRALEGAYFKRQRKVFELGDGEFIPYWESRECDFALG